MEKILSVDEKNNKDQKVINRDQIRGLVDKMATVMVQTGRILLESGSEVARVEKTMDIIGNSVNDIESAISYVTMTGLMVTVSSHGVVATKIARIHEVGHDLAKIRRISTLSHRAQTDSMTPEELLEELEIIDKTPQYKPWQFVLFAAIGAAGFGIFFDEPLSSIPWIFGSALLVQLIGVYLDRHHINSYLKLLLEAGCAAVFCYYSSLLSPESQYNSMLLSVLMLLVPGMTLTNSLRDFMSGNYVAGSSRFTEALLVGISIAMGTAIAIALIQGAL